MNRADLVIVNDLFNCVAPAAAAEMKGRALAVLRTFSPGPAADARLMLNDITEEIEALPLSKETTT